MMTSPGECVHPDQPAVAHYQQTQIPVGVCGCVCVWVGGCVGGCVCVCVCSVESSYKVHNKSI